MTNKINEKIFRMKIRNALKKEPKKAIEITIEECQRELQRRNK